MSRRRFTIAYDMDETLFDLMNPWLDLYNNDYDDNITRSDIKGWSVHMWVKPECGKKIYEYLAMPGLFEEMRPFDGIVESLERHHAFGDRIVLVSSVPISAPNSYGEKLYSVKKNFPFLPDDCMIACHRKELINADFLVDDGGHNLIDFPGIATCIDRPWNIADKCDMRVNDVNEFVKIRENFDDTDIDCLHRAKTRRLTSIKCLHNIF